MKVEHMLIILIDDCKRILQIQESKDLFWYLNFEFLTFDLSQSQCYIDVL